MPCKRMVARSWAARIEQKQENQKQARAGEEMKYGSGQGAFKVTAGYTQSSRAVKLQGQVGRGRRAASGVTHSVSCRRLAGLCQKVKSDDALDIAQKHPALRIIEILYLFSIHLKIMFPRS